MWNMVNETERIRLQAIILIFLVNNIIKSINQVQMHVEYF